MTAPEPEPEIDWERKFHEQVSDNIRNKARASEKLAEVQLLLDQERGNNRALSTEIRRLTPAGDKYAALEEAYKKQGRDFEARLTTLMSEIRTLKAEKAGGQRAVIESVIEWMTYQASKLPKPVEKP